MHLFISHILRSCKYYTYVHSIVPVQCPCAHTSDQCFSRIFVFITTIGVILFSGTVSTTGATLWCASTNAQSFSLKGEFPNFSIHTILSSTNMLALNAVVVSCDRLAAGRQ